MCDRPECKRRRGREIETVYLPGDREPTEIARAIRRESRLTPAESRAALLAWECANRKFFYYGERCSLRDPCRYCKEVERL